MFDNRERPVGLRRNTNSLMATESDIPQIESVENDVRRPSLGVDQTALAQLHHPQETPLFWTCAIISLLLYPLLIIGLHVLIPFFLLFSFLLHGYLTGTLKGNCIRVSERQLPQVYHATEAISAQLGIEQPPVYVLQSGGALNAFATRFLMKDYIVLYSDVVEMAYEQGPEALNFVIAHELAHIARKHVRHAWLIKPAAMIPLLPQAYYRACEYSCDLIAAHCAPKGAVGGLMALSAGKKLRHHVDASVYAAQVNTENSFWVWLAELFATHPNLPKRVDAVMNLSIVQRQQHSTDSQHLAPVA